MATLYRHAAAAAQGHPRLLRFGRAAVTKARRVRHQVQTLGLGQAAAQAIGVRLLDAARSLDQLRKRRPAFKVRVEAEAAKWLAQVRQAPRPIGTNPADPAYDDYLHRQLLKSLRLSSRFSIEKKTKLLLQKYTHPPVSMLARIDATARIAAASLQAAAGEPRVLSVGCRDELELLVLRQVFKSSAVVGLDIFAVAPAITCGDMHAMPFGDREFDVVMACHSLEHAFDPHRAIRECVRVLKPGGVLAIEVPIKVAAADELRANPVQAADRWDFSNAKTVLRHVTAVTGAVTVLHEADLTRRADRSRAQLVVRVGAAT